MPALLGVAKADRLWGDAGFDTVLARGKYPDQRYAGDDDLTADGAQVDALDRLTGLLDLLV